MRSIAILLSLVATVASAQQPDAPTAPPPPPPLTPAPPTEPPPPPKSAMPGATGPSESSGERAIRYSRFSAGPGGPLLAFTQVISGITSGAMIGHSYDNDHPDEKRGSRAYTGAMVTGLTLGTMGTLYQYYVPVERNESFLVSGAATAGFIAGLTVGLESDMSTRSTAWLTLGTTQLGVLSVLALTSGPGDVSTGDAALVGMMSLYAFTLTGLTQAIADASGSGDINLTPTFLAPAAGMALGALLATQLELDPGRVVKLTLVPLGVGATMLWLGSALADGTTVPLTAMAGIVTSFALTLLLTSDPGVPTEREGVRRADFEAVPVPVVMATGHDKSSLAAGPGLFMRF